MPRTIAEIDAQIRELNLERSQSMADENARREAVIKSLEWTKECEAHVHVTQILAVGMPAFTISVSGPVPIMPSNGPVTVHGDHKNYEKNVEFGNRSGLIQWDGHNSSPPCFYTSSEDALEDFLSRVTFKRVRFNERHLRVLLAAHNAAKKCEMGW